MKKRSFLFTFILLSFAFAAAPACSLAQEPAVKVIKLNFVSTSEVAALLDAIKSMDGKVIANEESKSIVLMDEPQRVRTMEELIRQIDIQTVTENIQLQFSRANDVLDEVRPLLTQSVGVIMADMDANRITVTDTPSVVDKVRRAVEALDPLGRKIILEVKLVHVVLNDEHLDGVDWTGIVSDYQNLRLEGRYDFLGGRDKGEFLSLGTIEGRDYVPLIEALDTIGSVKEYPVSNMSLMSDTEVRMMVRFDNPDVSLEAVSDESEGDLSTERASVDFMLKPQVDVDGTIKTTIVEREMAGLDQPMVSGRPLTSIALQGHKPRSVSARCSDGGSIVFGGLIATEQVLIQRKIPIMGDIPLLGFAFRYHNSSVRREEFVIIVTPKIVAAVEVKFSGDVPVAVK